MLAYCFAPATLNIVSYDTRCGLNILFIARLYCESLVGKHGIMFSHRVDRSLTQKRMVQTFKNYVGGM